LTNVELRKMDAEHLEFPDQTFDFVTCAFALNHFPDMEAALHEMYRVCKPAGYIGVANFNSTPPPFNPGWPMLFQQCAAYGVAARLPQPLAYTPQEVETLLNRFGFHSVETYSESNDIVFAKLEDYWAFNLTVTWRVPITRLDEETRARFKDEYLAKLRPMLREDGLHMSLAIIYALAKR
jgi:ubiquinone/menaquinone biosynthesis C-methylase UbiE